MKWYNKKHQKSLQLKTESYQIIMIMLKLYLKLCIQQIREHDLQY